MNVGVHAVISVLWNKTGSDESSMENNRRESIRSPNPCGHRVRHATAAEVIYYRIAWSIKLLKRRSRTMSTCQTLIQGALMEIYVHATVNENENESI